MKKKTACGISAIVVLAVALSIFLFVFWGKQKDTRAYSVEEGAVQNADEIGKLYLEAANESDGEIYAQGKTGAITAGALERTTKFYMLSGMDEESAKEKALTYLMRNEAMYRKAVELGYTATKEDIEAYVEQMKTAVKEADNKEETEAIISQFPSEEEYWKSLSEQAVKIVPVDKYLHDLEKEYHEKYTSKEERTAGTGDEEDGFRDYLEELRNDLVQEQGFTVVAK